MSHMRIGCSPRRAPASCTGRHARGCRDEGIRTCVTNVRSRSRSRRMDRSEEHTSELQSLMRISYAVFCLKKKKRNNTTGAARATDTTIHLHHLLQLQTNTNCYSKKNNK